MSKKFTLIYLLFSYFCYYSQSVGLVLSGGGAAGFAHIGVLKALEENNIRVDYITSTSAGAIIGGLYSLGYTAKEIEKMAISKEFYLASKGNLSNNINKSSINYSKIIEFKFDEKLDIIKTLPLSITNPILIDFFLLNNFNFVDSKTEIDFDSLLIPFRCVSTDLTNNRLVVFDHGNMSEAIRASMTYPFYIPPIMIDSNLMFDGGIINNFTHDIMYKEYMPDLIIGSSVTEERKNPDQWDIGSQLISMIKRKSSFEFQCKDGILIRPDVNHIGVLEFEEVQEAIDSGYSAGLKIIDSILLLVDTNDFKNFLEKRQLFRSRINRNNKIINNLLINSVNSKETQFIKNNILSNKIDISLSDLEKKCIRLIGNDKFEYIFPKLIKNKNDSNYTIELSIKKENSYNLVFGGFYSSNLSNIGFFGFEFKNLNRNLSFTNSINSYFGRFYNSIALKSDISFSKYDNLSIHPFFIFNRFDYFNVYNAFFDDKKPSYLIDNMTFGGIDLLLSDFLSLDNLKISYYLGQDFMRYFQYKNFTTTDTTDKTNLFVNVIGFNYKYNTLNYNYLSTEGTLFDINLSYNIMRYNTLYGNTYPNPNFLIIDNQNYFDAKLNFTRFQSINQKTSIGFKLEANYTNRKNLDNLSNTFLFMPRYKPIPELNTYFDTNLISPIYVAGGVIINHNIFYKFDFRLEFYNFLPFMRINMLGNTFNYKNINYKTTVSKVGSLMLIYRSPIGPLFFTTNYFPENKKFSDRFSIGINFNFQIFNRKLIQN